MATELPVGGVSLLRWRCHGPTHGVVAGRAVERLNSSARWIGAAIERSQPLCPNPRPTQGKRTYAGNGVLVHARRTRSVPCGNGVQFAEGDTAG